MPTRKVARVIPLVVQTTIPKPIVNLIREVTPTPLQVSVALKTPTVVLV